MYVFDPFQGVAAGSGTPAGWSGPSFGSGTVETYATAPGGPFTPHQWFSFSGNLLETPVYGPDAGSTIWFAWRGLGSSNQGQIMSAQAPRNGGGNDIPAFLVQFEDDQTISLYVGPVSGANLMGNTGSIGRSFPAGVWFYLQINVALSLQTVSGVQRLKATADLFVDGVLLLSNVSAVSDTFINTDFASSTPEIHQIAWFQGNGSGDAGLAEPYVGPSLGAGVGGFPGNLWEVTVTDPGAGYTAATAAVGAGNADLAAVVTGGGVTSVVAAAPNYFGSGYGSAPTVTIAGDGVGATATASLAPSPFRRVAQAAMELAALPTTANLRVPQLLIEVATLPGPPPIVPVVGAPSAGGGRFIFQPVYCLVPPPGKPKYKGCGRKPDCFSVPEREWVDLPHGGRTFNPQGAILLPAPTAGDTVIFQFAVPIGYDGMILGQYNTLTAKFAQGSGDIVWRVSSSNRYLRDRGNILVSFGTTRKLDPIPGGLLIRSGALIQFIVNAGNAGGSLPAPGSAYVLAGLHGVFWPRK